MGFIRILQPAAISALTVSRGTGGANLLTNDPKEVWTDSAVGSGAEIRVDFGAAISIDTVALAAIYGPAAAGSTWSAYYGTAGYYDVPLIAGGTTLRAAEPASGAPAVSHALLTINPFTARYLSITVNQPAGNPALQIGRIMAGLAFTPTWNKEWGSGRKVIDTGSATRLPSGGFAVVDGAKASSYAWTLGDLTDAEVDALFALQTSVGQTGPVLVVEDPAATTGQVYRIHYGLLTQLRAYERRNPKQTRWELSMEDWI